MGESIEIQRICTELFDERTENDSKTYNYTILAYTKYSKTRNSQISIMHIFAKVFGFSGFGPILSSHNLHDSRGISEIYTGPSSVGPVQSNIHAGVLINRSKHLLAVVERVLSAGHLLGNSTSSYVV